MRRRHDASPSGQESKQNDAGSSKKGKRMMRPTFDPEREDRGTRLMRLLSHSDEGSALVREWVALTGSKPTFDIWLWRRLEGVSATDAA